MEVLVRQGLVSTVVAASFAFGTPAVAADGTMWGGEIPDAPAFHAEAGFPWIEFGYRIPMGNFEIMPFGRFFYMRYLAVNIGVDVGAEGRLQLLDGDKVNGALTLAVPVHLFFNNGVAFGIGLLHPGWMIDYAVADTMSLVFGVRFEDDLFIGGGTAIFAPTIPLIVGFEAQLEGLTLGGKIEGGPAFIAGLVSGEVRALFGVDF